MDFSSKANFTLNKMDIGELASGIKETLIDGESILSVSKSVGVQVVFTNKRIIAVDMPTLMNKSRTVNVMPYSKVMYFSVQTITGKSGLSELMLYFRNGLTAKFVFSGDFNIDEITKQISKIIL